MKFHPFLRMAVAITAISGLLTCCAESNKEKKEQRDRERQQQENQDINSGAKSD